MQAGLDAAIELAAILRQDATGMVPADEVWLDSAVQRNVPVVWGEVLGNGEFDAGAILHLEKVLHHALAKRLLAQHKRTLVVLQQL